jgi:DNA-binding response OmpR family regulator
MGEQKRMNRPLNVLIVEDDPVVAETIASLLVLNDVAGSMTTERVVTLKEAEERIEAGLAHSGKLINAVILDLLLPDASDLQALDAMRQRWTWLPIIVVTGAAITEGAVLDAGACDFFVKSRFTGSSLVHSIRKSVVRRGAMARFTEARVGLERTGTVIAAAKETAAKLEGK